MKRRVLLLMLVSCLFVLSGVASASLPWAEYGGDAQNTGQSSYIGPQTTEYNWKVALEGDNSDSFVSPVIDGSGTIYLLDNTGRFWGEYDKQGNYVYYQTPSLLKAVNKSGVVKWTKEVDEGCENNEGNASLALGTNGILYLVCGSGRDDGKVYALETDSGRTRWEIPLSDRIYSVGSLTLDSQNRLYISIYGGEVMAVSPTGTILWRNYVVDSSEIAGPVLSTDEKTLYVYGYGYLNAVSTDTGQVIWSTILDWGGTGWQTFTSFTVDTNGTIWMASYRKPDPNTCYGRAEYLISISPDGYITNQMPLEGDMDCGSHVRIGPSGTVYITSDTVQSNWYWDGAKWVRRNWNQEWRWDGTQWNLIWVETRSYLDGTEWVYETYDNSEPVERVKGGIAAYDPVNGFKWRFELPDSCEANASPAIDANENIYFAASYGERLYSLNKDGQVNWEFNIAPGVEPSHCYNRQSSQAGNDQLAYGVAPVIGPNGSVYFMGEKNLYGIDTKISEGSIIENIKNMVQSGTVDSGSGSALIRKLDDLSSATDTRTRATKISSIIGMINDMESTGKIDSASAEQLRTAVIQL